MKLLLILFTVCLLQIVLAGEVRNIEYSLNITFNPYCVDNVCVNETISEFNNITNVTTNYTKQTCSANCYGKIILNGIDQNQFFSEIDFGIDRWKNGSSELRYGYKAADLGNLSDISGIRQELQNLTTCFSTHLGCTANLSECTTQKTNLDSFINQKNSEIDELKKKDNQKWFWLIGGVLAGVVLIKFVIPSIQGTRNPKDPTTAQFPSNPGWK